LTEIPEINKSASFDE
jgi:hypothetical protein